MGEEANLKSRLQDWTDWDLAAYNLAICLGLMPDDPAFGGAKHVFWGANKLGESLYLILDKLVEQGALEKRDEPDIQCRWNPSFR